MKALILSLFLFTTARGFAADQTCQSLSVNEFTTELISISQEHEQMKIEEIHADYAAGVLFIKNNFGEESIQYKAAMTFVSETSDMTINDMQIVESLRIQIIPIMGPQSIYKGHDQLLMRDCRPNLLAAMILT